MAELLSICIPTRNRSQYLQELLESIGREIESEPEIGSKIKIYISDNASNDLTWDVCQKFYQTYKNLDYSSNESDLGSGNNIFKCCNTGIGKYRWVVGDDELIAS
ncbi:MAG: glycosyltransferase, partial [Planctomycetes bacterium]|nr:glycosyltransferase [Planctomycetota bacterium]